MTALSIKHAPIRSGVSAVSYAGLSITAPDGQPATLAVIDNTGNIIEAGRNVESAVWNAAIESHQQFLIGCGHMRVHSSPPAVVGADTKVA